MKAPIALLLLLLCVFVGSIFIPLKTTKVRIEDKWWETAYDVAEWQRVYHSRTCYKRRYDSFRERWISESYDCSYNRDEWVIQKTYPQTGREHITYAPLPELRCAGQQNYGCQQAMNYRVVFYVVVQEHNKKKTCMISEVLYQQLVWHRFYNVRQNFWNAYQCNSLTALEERDPNGD